MADRPHIPFIAGSIRGRLAEKLFNTQAATLVTQRQHFLCIGDSHVAVFNHVRVPSIWFRVLEVEGATASGVLNPNSTTNASHLFATRLQHAKPWQHVVVCLGEVDCGFVIWHRAQRHELKVDDQFYATLNSYLVFLGQIKAKSFASLHVLSVPLPTITDYPSEWGKVANLRKEIAATQRERTNLTLRFNRELQEHVTNQDIGFIDATSDQLDPSTGLIYPDFVQNQLDHHLDSDTYATLIAQAFRESGVPT